jgi:hypothetical protein
MDNGAIGFFLFFVILIIIWIFAMGGCVRERKSLGVYEGLTKGRKEKNLENNVKLQCNGKIPCSTQCQLKQKCTTTSCAKQCVKQCEKLCVYNTM